MPTSFTLSCVLICIGLICTIYIFVYSKNKNLGKYCSVNNLQPIRQPSANYLMAYVLPFIVFDFDKINDIFIFFIIYGLLMLLYVKYNLIYFNLVLEIFGYIVCKGDIERGDEIETEAIIILRSSKHVSKKSFKLDNIGNGMYFNVTPKENNKYYNN
jgi:hypothetical protein